MGRDIDQLLNVPPDDAFRPNKAGKCLTRASWPEPYYYLHYLCTSRSVVEDFDTTSFEVMYVIDEGNPQNQLDATVSVIDDALNEATEQVYVVLLDVMSPDSSQIGVTRNATLVRIIDNDRK